VTPLRLALEKKKKPSAPERRKRAMGRRRVGERRELGEGRELGGGGGGSGGECDKGEERRRRSGGKRERSPRRREESLAVEAEDPEASAAEEWREKREISASERSSGWRETTSWRSLAVEAKASAVEEKRGDRGAEGEERDLRVREELGVAGDDVVAELGEKEADRLVETLGDGV
ncbi:unnamed protein product, partial [Brassica napus]